VVACLAMGSCESHKRTERSAPTTSSVPSSSTVSTAAPTQSSAATANGTAGGLPPDFSAGSVTFVSLKTGWVLGSAPCAAARCTQVWKTADGGRTWAQVPAPPLPVSPDSDPGAGRIRFANADDGWVWGSDLWATHDGGAHWAKQSIGSVYALETSAGAVHGVVLSYDGTSTFGVKTSPVHSDAWRTSAIKIQAGAGPVPRAQLVLHGTAGWMVIVNRTVVGGARLENGRWVSWKPPCDDAGTPLELAASMASDLVAFCADGLWNDLPPGERIYVSTDGGSSFRRLPASPPFRDASAVAAAAPQVWVAGGAESNAQGGAQAVLFRTGDGGRTWKAVHREGGASWLDLGFTSPEQGVVISEGNVDRLLMTYDGGQTWSPVATR
jgi:hypothetical protein